MRKIYSFMLFAILSISAFAEPDGYYYWFYDEVKAEPTGKGKIYVSQDYVDEFETPIEYQESMELKVCVEGFSQGTLYTYEQPAEGYQFVGWRLNGVMITSDNPYSFTVSEHQTYYAVFNNVED